MAHVFLNHSVAIELLPSTCPPVPNFPPPPSGGERPAKVQKPNDKPLSKDAQKKQQLQNKKPLTEYIIEGKEVWKPYYEFGYNKNEKNPDPNSTRSKNKAKGDGGKGQKRQRRRQGSERWQSAQRRSAPKHGTGIFYYPFSR